MNYEREKQLGAIRRDFQAQLDSGFFQVIESGPEIYPPMDFALTKRTFNDSVERVIWRTKQVSRENRRVSGQIKHVLKYSVFVPVAGKIEPSHPDLFYLSQNPEH